MDFEILIPLLAIFSVIFVPVTGLMVILTTRFALKPMAETLAKALRESRYSDGPGLLPHLGELTEQVQDLAREVRRLKEAQEFDRNLLGTGSGGSEPQPSSPREL